MEKKSFVGFLAIILILTTITGAVPANPALLNLTQPDGTTFKAKQIGDERQFHFETLDDYTIIQDKVGYWVYAQTNKTVLLPTQNKVGKANIKNLNFTKHLSPKRIDYEQTNNHYVNRINSNISYSPKTTGTTKAVVILIGFTDVQPSLSYTPSYFNNLLFSTSSGTKSLTNYYNEVSYDQFNIVGAVSPKWYTSSHTMSYYGADSSSGIDNANGRISNFAKEAFSLADIDIDFSQYDGDGDGVVDHVIIIHAGNDQSGSRISNDIWSYQGSVNVSVDGVKIEGYTMLAQSSPLGTFAHEFGHDIGLPDLYDTDTGASTVEAWDIMDDGSWNNNGNTPSHPSAWSKIQLGWINPVTVTTQTRVNVPQLETNQNNSVYRVSSSNMPSTEYFLVENRQKTGYDSYLPDDGIVIWHIDDAQGSLLYNDVNNGDVKRVAVEDASNGLITLLRGAAYSSGDQETIFSPSSLPGSNSNTGVSTGISIYDIGPSGSSMTVNFSKSSESVLSIMASQYNVSAGVPVNITFSVIPAISGATITLSGAGINKSGTTDSSGTFTILINASNIGTILANASKTGFISGIAIIKVLSSNDNPGGANYLDFGIWYSGLIYPKGDVDWSYVILNRTGTLTFDLITPLYYDYDLEIFGPDNYTNLTGISDNPMPSDEKVQIKNAIQGKYYAKVYGYDLDYSSIWGYYIRANFTPSAITEKITVGSTTVTQGKTAIVSIQVTGVTTNIAAATVELTFDPAVVTVNSVTPGILGTPITNINNTSGNVLITVINTTPATAAPIILANVVLQGVLTASPGATSPLTLTVNALSDSNGANRNPGASGITSGVATIGNLIKGDVNNDGTVTIVDALFVAQYTVGTRTLTPEQLAEADVNNDGQVTIVDALFIAQYTVGLRQLSIGIHAANPSAS